MTARDAEHETEHHNHGEAVADAGLEVGVKLEPPACAKAERVLRVRIAATMKSEGSRERTLVLMCLVNFIRVVMFVVSFVLSGFSAESRDHNLTSARSEDVCDTQHARSVPARN